MVAAAAAASGKYVQWQLPAGDSRVVVEVSPIILLNNHLINERHFNIFKIISQLIFILNTLSIQGDKENFDESKIS